MHPVILGAEDEVTSVAIDREPPVAFTGISPSTLGTTFLGDSLSVWTRTDVAPLLAGLKVPVSSSSGDRTSIIKAHNDATVKEVPESQK